MEDMARREVLPAVQRYAGSLAAAMADKAKVDPALVSGYEKKASAAISGLLDEIDQAADALAEKLTALDRAVDVTAQALLVKGEIIPAMEALRKPCDKAESMVGQKDWPFPTYGDLLFGV
jgi:glutamine synthetase